MDRYSFPQDFVWGIATSSYQIEGAAWKDGRGESIWDRFCRADGTVADGSTGDVACDHYHRYHEDIRLMQDLGIQSYRFSIAWPRILPQGYGALNLAGIDFYRRLVDTLLEAGIRPMATLYHWDLPQHLQDQGGWPSRDTAYRFADYAGVLFDRLGDRVTRWVTHNEPWVAAFVGHWIGEHAPGVRDLQQALDAAHHLLLSHGLVVERFRAAGGDGEIGITLNINLHEAASASESDLAAARRADGANNRWFLDPVFFGAYPQDIVSWLGEKGYTVPVAPGDMETIAAPIDFLGLNYYNRVLVAQAAGGGPLETKAMPPRLPTTEMGWEIYPEGLYRVLTRLHREYAPRAVYVTENGAAFPDDPKDGRILDGDRIAYLRDHFIQAHRAIQDGVPLAGYYVWSFLDNFEWAFGYTRRFGIVWVDFATQKRILKDSALWYRDVIAANCVEGSGDEGVPCGHTTSG